METLGKLESFVRSAEAGSFSGASRKLGLSAGAVSKNVARLEESVGVLLFNRTTRSLTLTEAGSRFLSEVNSGLTSIQDAIVNLSAANLASGVLKISAPYAFGREHLLPLMPDFVGKFPAVVPDWHFDNRQVDLVTEGFDVAIGGGIELAPGVVARELMKIHMVALASPKFLRGRAMPVCPRELAQLDGIAMRSTQTGRIRSWQMLHLSGEQFTVSLKPSIIVSDPEALCSCARMGMGVTIAPLTQAAPFLRSGELVRILPDWHADVGALWLYFNGTRLLPAKTKVFVEYMVEHFKSKEFAHVYCGVVPA